VRLNAHYGITCAGEVNYVNPVTDFIWHAQGLSGPNVGIEVEGKFPGQDSKPTPERPDGLTDGQKEGIRDCLEHIASVCPHRPLAIYAHRQSTAARRIDPGEAIWRFIVEAVELDDRFVLKPLVALGSGRPIPACWGGVKGETL
jgi:N-acetyl-anhydromuramyl-L-alanine amidase AmpD